MRKIPKRHPGEPTTHAQQHRFDVVEEPNFKKMFLFVFVVFIGFVWFGLDWVGLGCFGLY